MIKLNKIDDKTYNVLNINDKQIGTFELDVDGLYYFWNLEYNVGSWSSNTFREVADKLDEINNPFENQIDEYFYQEQVKAEKEYKELLNSGLFHEFYPALTGDLERDKEEWFKIHSKLEDLRNKVKENINNCSCGNGVKEDGDYYCRQCLKNNPFLCT